VIITKWK